MPHISSIYARRIFVARTPFSRRKHRHERNAHAESTCGTPERNAHAESAHMKRPRTMHSFNATLPPQTKPAKLQNNILRCTKKRFPASGKRFRV